MYICIYTYYGAPWTTPLVSSTPLQKPVTDSTNINVQHMTGFAQHTMKAFNAYIHIYIYMWWVCCRPETPPRQSGGRVFPDPGLEDLKPPQSGGGLPRPRSAKYANSFLRR